MIYDVTVDGATFSVELKRSAEKNSWRCRISGREIALDAVFPEPGVLSLILEGRTFEYHRESSGGDLFLVEAESHYQVAVRDPRSFRGRKTADAARGGPKNVRAPMPGRILRVLAAVGDAVEAGAPLLVIEAMKMQNEIRSPKKGTVRKLLAEAGATVSAGDALAVVE
ncbi:MAG: biotin/lipoyl-containing protein [Terriglobales bacterium]